MKQEIKLGETYKNNSNIEIKIIYVDPEMSVGIVGINERPLKTYQFNREGRCANFVHGDADLVIPDIPVFHEKDFLATLGNLYYKGEPIAGILNTVNILDDTVDIGYFKGGELPKGFSFKLKDGLHGNTILYIGKDEVYDEFPGDMNFLQAIQAMKKGKRVALADGSRISYHLKGQELFNSLGEGPLTALGGWFSEKRWVVVKE